jgi:SNF2 family DNA or RNA helicase
MRNWFPFVCFFEFASWTRYAPGALHKQVMPFVLRRTKDEVLKAGGCTSRSPVDP